MGKKKRNENLNLKKEGRKALKKLLKGKDVIDIDEGGVVKKKSKSVAKLEETEDALRKLAKCTEIILGAAAIVILGTKQVMRIMRKR